MANSKSDLEEQMRWILEHLGPEKLTGPVEEEVRPLLDRRYRLDFGYPQLRVAVEVQGGVWARRKDPVTGKALGSAHTGMGHERDMEKLNTLQIAGWIVLQFSSKMIHEDPCGVAETVCRAIRARI